MQFDVWRLSQGSASGMQNCGVIDVLLDDRGHDLARERDSTRRRIWTNRGHQSLGPVELNFTASGNVKRLLSFPRRHQAPSPRSADLELMKVIERHHPARGITTQTASPRRAGADRWISMHARRRPTDRAHQLTTALHHSREANRL